MKTGAPWYLDEQAHRKYIENLQMKGFVPDEDMQNDAEYHPRVGTLIPASAYCPVCKLNTSTVKRHDREHRMRNEWEVAEFAEGQFETLHATMMSKTVRR